MFKFRIDDAAQVLPEFKDADGNVSDAAVNAAIAQGMRNAPGLTVYDEPTPEPVAPQYTPPRTRKAAQDDAAT